ncbi:MULTISPECIES: maleylacetoacetate isomerase [unclassified Sphingomonas]|jgi:maleylacetoacetate isomerase|uniref:maleylacetoacetate isomerase n=1 Tax=unclassified Sphingomonas TaxID=196159 RepID=UPI0008370353|nr:MULTISPECIES: maleylacetoacetate isomerase [unclassified Sphingomonas]MCH4893936.1 maleylacetoacetate isomerase [Sphingomonas sp. SFZ2018-12]
MPSIRLMDYARSSAAYRVRIALNLKGVPWERHPVSLVDGDQRSAAFLAANPQGLVPALDIGDGTILTQSLAIIDWLEATYPEPRLIPADPLARARALSLALAIACDIHPLNNLRVLKRLETQFDADRDARMAWYAHWIVTGLAAIEEMAGDGPYLGGEAPDIADVFLVPQIANARRFSVPLDAFPRLVAIDAAATALPAFAAAHPDHFV